MSARFLYIILLCVVLLFSSASYAASANSITVSGTVLNSITRNPVESATVSTVVSGVSFKAVTDDSGNYSLNISFDKKPFLIILVASKQGYLPSIKFLSNIKPGRSYTVNFTMRDITPPSKPVVSDDGEYLIVSNSLHANWLSEDSESGIKEYRYSVGTGAGSTDILGWTSAGANTEITLSNLTLNHNGTYYFNIRAINGANLPSQIGSSDGITVNAHIPEITRVIPYSDTTMTVGDGVIIEAAAQDLDNDPVEYRFSIDGGIRQPFSSLNTFNYTVEPSTSNTHTLKVEVRDDKNGLVSQEVTYNIQNVVIDTTPPPAPAITTNPQSSSLNSIEAQWSSEDPESGIIEYQYAIGAAPGGTDVVYWTTYGNNTQAFLSGLNLTKGRPYYLSVVAKNGAGLKSAVSTSPQITARKEPYVKIYYPYQNAIINSGQIKGIAEGMNQITINGKPVAVNEDGSFEGPILVSPGSAKFNNISSDDPDYIVMNFPGITAITASGGGEEDSVSFYYISLFLKSEKDVHQTAPLLSIDWHNIRQCWNYSSFTEPPFAGWATELPTSVREGYPPSWNYGTYLGPGFQVSRINYAYTYDEDNDPTTPNIVATDGFIITKTDYYIHTPPAIKDEIKPLILVLEGCGFLEGDSPSQYKVNGQSLKRLYDGLDANAYYVVLSDYVPDSDLKIDVEAPYYPDRVAAPHIPSYGYQQSFACSNINALTVDTVREIPYASGNYVPVNTISIFQPDDGKGRGPSLELVNMPFLALRFNEEPSGSQANTLEAKLTIADETKAYNLNETAVDSNIFVDPGNGVTVKLDSLPTLNPNTQDELTCSVSSSFGNLTNKLFNLKESASDSLYFNDVKTFVTITFNSELLPYQADTLTIQYDNGMMAPEETLTETSPDSLVFSNEDSTFTVKVNNYQGTLPDNLDITINNTDYLEISTARLQLPKVNTNPYVYTNEPTDGGSDLPPNNPLDEGQGIFRIMVAVDSPTYITDSALPSLAIALSTDLGSKTLNFTQQADGSHTTPPMVLLPENDLTTYNGTIPLNSTSGEDKIKLVFKDIDAYTIFEQLKNAVKGAFVGRYLSGYKDTISKIKGILDGIGYTTIPDEELTKQDILNAVPNYSIWYSLTHGSTPSGDETTPFAAIKVGSSKGPWDSKDNGDVYPNDIAAHIGDNSYKFVFLNGCLTADERPGSAAVAFKSYFKAQEYLGWKVDTGQGSTVGYAEIFFGYLSKNNRETGRPITVMEARRQMILDRWYGMGMKGFNQFIVVLATDARYLGDGITHIHLEK